jgi:hypothetical protein
MKNQTDIAEDNTELLRYLLDQEQRERKDIHTELHSQKGDLLMINFVLHNMQKSSKEGTFKPEHINDIKKIIDGYLENMRPILTQTFNPMIKLSGLKCGLLDIVSYCRDKHSSAVTLKTQLDEINYKVDVITELGIYKVCFETAQYLCLCGYKSISINLISIDEDLVVKVHGILENQQVKTDEALTERLKLIKANLVWRSAEILSETNWENTFNFKFRYEAVSNSIQQC